MDTFVISAAIVVATWICMFAVFDKFSWEAATTALHSGGTSHVSDSRQLIEATNTAAVHLKSSPITSSWIIAGNPVARSTVLSKSADGLTWTMVWECSEGVFNWYYDLDETILILEGSIVLENATMSPTRYGPGDVVFFKNGAHARWHVEGHVRKLAFLSRSQPILLAFVLRACSKIKRIIVPGPGSSSLTAD
jgi:hypothetical protein